MFPRGGLRSKPSPTSRLPRREVERAERAKRAERVTTRRNKPITSRTEVTKRKRRGVEEEEKEKISYIKKHVGEKKRGVAIGKLSTITAIAATVTTRRQIEVLNYPKIDKEDDPDPENPASLKGTLYDSAMGRSSYCSKCGKCDDPDCAGHNGYIDLGELGRPDYIDPFLNPAAGPLVKDLYNIICTHCGGLTFTTKELERAGLARARLENRIKGMAKLLKPKITNRTARCLLSRPGAIGLGEERAGCNLPVPHGGPAVYDKKTNQITVGSEVVATRTIHALFSKINSEDARLLGFKTYRPADWFHTFVIVIPPSMREITLKGVDEKKSDFFGQEYKAIIKKKKEILSTKNAEKRNKLIENLHERIFNVYVARKKGFSRPGTQEFKGYKGEITGKEGIIRKTMTGKRLDYTSRAVLGTDNDLMFQYIGVPIEICNNSYEILNITEHTIPYLKKLLKQGKLVHYLPKSGYYSRYRFVIADVLKKGKDLKLVIGDEVTRPLEDGDDMIMGRNPTIHKLGLMGFRIKREYSDTIKLNQAYTTPFNADFDGDEGHQQKPQGLMEKAECRFIFNVIFNIINSENGAPSMGLVMDAISSAYVMTASADLGYMQVTKEEYEKLRSMLTIRDGEYKLDERLAHYNINKYSTRGIWALLFPHTYNVTVEAKDQSIIQIRDGILMSGTLSKQNVGPARGGFVHDLCIYYGFHRAAHFINDAKRLAIYFLEQIRGLTIGMEDAQIGNEYVKTLTNANRANIGASAYNIDIPTRDPLEQERRENEIINLLQNKANSAGQKLTREVLTPVNGFRIPISAGAKGDIFHASQMVAEGGQQYEFGQRIMNDMTDGTRVSPYSHPNEHTLESRGYISNSLGDGFNAQDELAHFIATRVTLIDTTTKTADAGDYHHLENLFLLDELVQYDGSLRDLNGMIIQFVAGYDAVNPMHSEEIKYDGMSVPFWVNVDKLVDQINSEMAWGS